ncbi:Fe(3+) ABC transporter substrate-binding protein [Ruixingdingia sedimenti]|uniref:Fe(3+) ABC transporter substrate-binding protein n=1 Tax=Ruixingdingia sedimenti TaxID=3073604 RepID=A0ABU1F7Y3_9RHOB|nr:Fe(3+) ABC transporter substrate-binding protein [Xinfangfangia sp. LG-4]MDR5652983.1 Fe(3+) ABC transporter substrate-binding protein [Xinfangfangia sp. LG-4]
MTIRTTLLATAACALGLPALADEVNVYTTRQAFLIEPVMEAFTRETGIKVNLAFIEKGLVERLKSEGDRSPADLVMTVDIANLNQIVEADVLQPVDSAVLEAAVPEALQSPDNLWFALTTRARVIYASKDRVADGEVTTYEDLTDPKWKGRICTRAGVHDYNLALLAAVIAHDGAEKARAWAEGVKANLAKKPEGNDRSQVKSIWAGECDISLTNTYYMGAMLADPDQKAWAESVRIVFPTFEGGGTHVNVSGIAMTKAAPNRDAAVKLMEFLVSPEAQAIYAEVNHEFPVLEGAKRSDLVASWGDFTPDALNLTELAKLRPTALKIMEEVGFDN